ncbi:DnaJ family domain-containing protein [Chromobacterium sp. TRC.1.1.SA]|uniref:DnaJ family domain-containing protein n=1 Tax=Chromobacterium indicum TaxID=3110228 RepID=A0ABV0CP95_9NEIS
MSREVGHAEPTRSRGGELQRAKGWGKPLELNDGYAATPVELRTSYKILKDAGCVPA